MFRSRSILNMSAAAVLLLSPVFAWQQQSDPAPPATGPVTSSPVPHHEQAQPQQEQNAPAAQQLLIPRDRLTVPPPPPDPNEFRVSSDVELVLLDISVKDKEGGFVTGLSKDHFTVYDEKTQAPIRIFAAKDVPVTVGLVVDNSGSVRPKKPEIVTAALTFVTQSNPQDEMFLVNFNDRVLYGLPEGTDFTDDANLLRQGLLQAEPQGRTSLYDALKFSLEHIEKGRLDKKTLVLISDGGDNSSETTKQEIMDMAERSLATIYTVGIFNPDDKDKNPGFLKDLAKLTGGEYYAPGSIANLVGVCEKIAADIRNRYTVGFAPSGPENEKPRAIRVIVTDEAGRKLEARTRTHYVHDSHRGSSVTTTSRSRSNGR